MMINQHFSDELKLKFNKKNKMFDSQNTTQQNKKTFVFQNELTSQSSIVYHRINTDGPYTDIKPILDQYCPIDKNKIELYNTILSKFSPLEWLNPITPTLIPTQYLEFGFIMIRYKNLKSKSEIQQTPESYVEESSELSSNKKDRSKERTIGQVIELVKRWRKLHTANQGKKLNLQEAAKIVGVSKKSLDDYYYQLRIGEQFEYDFQQHLNDKIGDLRSFVKSKKPEKMQKHRNSKHPKRLRIIEDSLSFQEPEEDPQQEPKQEIGDYLPSQSPLMRSLSNQNDQFFTQSGSLGLDKNLERIENNYYDNFENFLDQDNDPYFYNGDFRKKDSYTFGSDSDILF